MGLNSNGVGLWLLGTGCAVMQVPSPLAAMGPVALEEDRNSGVVGPFRYEVARDDSLFVDSRDRRESWDFEVAFEGRALGSGSCRQAIRWPGQAVGERPRWGSDLRVALECELRSLTSTAAITLGLQSDDSGQDLAGIVRWRGERLEVSSTREVEGGRLPSPRRMGFIVARGGVPWAAIQTANRRQAWLPPTEPRSRDLLGLVVVALVTARPFTEEVLAQ